MQFVNVAVKQTKSVRATFRVVSILFGLVALSPMIFSFVSSFLPQDLIPFTNAYLLNMSFMLTQIFATAFTFVALDYLLKPRVSDLKEILSVEHNTDIASALIGAYTRNLRNSSVFLLIASAGFVLSSLGQLASAIQFAALGLDGKGGPAAEVYFLLAFQPLLVAVVLILLAVFLRRQARNLRSGLSLLETSNIGPI